MEGRLEYHGIIGHDGEWMLRELQAIHFPTDHIRVEEQIVRGEDCGPPWIISHTHLD